MGINTLSIGSILTAVIITTVNIILYNGLKNQDNN